MFEDLFMLANSFLTFLKEFSQQTLVEFPESSRRKRPVQRETANENAVGYIIMNIC